MTPRFVTFGEILWDCLPSGRHPGGAPFNVAVHLARLGAAAALVSAVGRDAPGDELLARAERGGVQARLVGRARAGLPTGTVFATLDAHGNAAYDITHPAAWDEIAVTPEALAAAARAGAVVYGSLAARGAHNLAALASLLAVPGSLKFFDVNLRPPHTETARVLALARHADVIKLNRAELTLLAAVGLANPPEGQPPDESTLAGACARLAEATGAVRVCVTLGADGAALWEAGALVTAPAPPVPVRDTVGAGDAFMAALTLGLTNGADPRAVLETACQLGAYVASQPGATPPLPPALAASAAARLQPPRPT